MKTINYLCKATALVALLIPLFTLNGHATLRPQDCGDPVIILDRDPEDYLNKPRSSEICPFYAEVQNGYVYLSSSRDMGTVYVEITSTAGDNYSGAFDTADTFVFLPISGNEGEYVLMITVSTDVHYIGGFEL